MADFITRLAERALGVAPVVQPLIASMFAPEPTTRSMDLAWDEETLAPRDDPDQTKSFPVVAPSPKKSPQDTETIQGEEQGAGAHVAPPLSSGPSGVPPDPRRLAGSSPSEHGVRSDRRIGGRTPQYKPNNDRRSPGAAEPDLLEGKVRTRGEEDRANSPSAGSPRGTSESRLGRLHPWRT